MCVVRECVSAEEAWTRTCRPGTLQVVARSERRIGVGKVPDDGGVGCRGSTLIGEGRQLTGTPRVRGNPLLGLYRVRAGPGSTDYAEEKTAALFVEGRKGGDSELWAVGSSGQGGRQDVSAGRQLRSIRACRRRGFGAAVVTACEL